jgi:hypothetical protein
MHRVRRVVDIPTRIRHSTLGTIAPQRRLPVLLALGAVALLASACGSSLGDNTPCSAYLSMGNSDQQSTIVVVLQQFGNVNPGSAAIASTQRAASAYCSYPMPGVNTIGGMFDSRPS